MSHGEGGEQVKLCMAVVSERRTYKLRKNETKECGILLCGEGKLIARAGVRLPVASGLTQDHSMQDKAIYHEGGTAFMEDGGGQTRNSYLAVVLEWEMLQIARD